MAPRETSRRAFLLGAGGVGASAVGGIDASATPGPGGSAVGVPDLRTDHEIRWQFESERDEAVLFPRDAGHGAVFVFAYAESDGDDPLSELRAFDRRTGEVRWSRPTANLPTIATGPNRRLYVHDDAGLFALDAADGSVEWDLRRENPRFGELRVGDGTVFVVEDDDLLALGSDDGSVEWRTATAGDSTRGLRLSGDSLVFGSTDGFTALRRADGRRRWHESLDEGAAWPAAVRDGLLVGWSRNAVYGLELLDGARRFRTDVGPVRAHAIGGTVSDSSAYVWSDRLVAVELSTGRRRWVYDPDDRNGDSPNDYGGFMPVVADGRVYASAEGVGVVALNAADGRERWRYEMDSGYFGYWGSVARGHVYVADEGRIRTLAADTGREQWSLDTGSNRRVWISAFDDLVVVGTRSGRFYAIDPPSRLLSAPLATAERFATSAPGLGLFGLLGAGLLGAGYRRATRDSPETDRDADATFGRLDRLGGGPITETYLKRVRSPDGPTLVAETRLTDAGHRDAFARAVERWAELDADGALPIREYGTDGGDADAEASAWFETAYLAGGSLADSWPLARRERVEVVSGAARAVHAAHREGVTHGRLAPRHVFRTDAGPAPSVAVGGWFLADALAGVRDDPDPYAPPERSAKENVSDEADASDVAADVYRLGALAARLHGVEVPPSEADSISARASLSGQLDDVLDRALATDPADRYESALAFDDEFRWAALDR